MRYVLALILVAGLLAACGDQQLTVEVATSTPIPTPEATRPSQPTSTDTPLPQPTATPTPAPTATPLPQPTATPTPAPTATPPPQPTATPTPAAAAEGRGRSNPYPFGTVAVAREWDFAAIQILRGDEARDQIMGANQFNDPPLDGREYVLVEVNATYTGTDRDTIATHNFAITGSSGILWGSASVVEPTPGLKAEVLPGGTTKGWIAFEVTEGESNLILVFNKLFDFDNSNSRYLALQTDAAVIPNWETLPQETNSGTTRADPVLPGQIATTESWTISIEEVVRGDKAWAAIASANPFNNSPPDGFEYILVSINVTNVSDTDAPANISTRDFRPTGMKAVLYPHHFVVEPNPTLKFKIFPEGGARGNIAFLVAKDDDSLMLRYAPGIVTRDSDIRFLALDDDAGVSPLSADLAQPTDAGTEISNPAPLGTTITTDTFELEIVDAIRGEEAMQRLKDANQFNGLPEPGMEYLLVKLRIRNISADEELKSIRRINFQSVGDRLTIWDRPLLVEPDPDVDADLYPGGVHEGWIALQAGIGETNLAVVYKLPFILGDTNRRYLAL